MNSPIRYLEQKLSASIIEEWMREHHATDPYFEDDDAHPYSSERYRFFYDVRSQRDLKAKRYRITIHNCEELITAEVESDSHSSLTASCAATILLDRNSEPLNQRDLCRKLDEFLIGIGSDEDRAENKQSNINSEEINSASSSLFEGALLEVTSDRYERNKAARDACISSQGAICKICGFDFGAAYGEAARGMIHVHHIVPLHESRIRHEVDPLVDLIPVCANCHMVLHSKKDGTYTPDEVREMLDGSSA